ncbi:uncharacterized protein BCR38DRAFT_483535 [Pseudomassariella vexata]|uniref:Zn(2)-C6 fungal-type domain-containing protein n=1 Tax=Pseudomassariella vexata TaxID=1141098 RepID=A0A1Y2E2T5_9PEZI|nr:uncharacterized protein BCR38DRAFT_483535 [Pseudomassariella vexata]ORY65861.1 hypothetical protein BCR38DRAFT_483535 [Pseudomassariella vexata]
MSTQEKSSPPGSSSQERLRHDQDSGFSLGIDSSRLASCFANFSFCPPCSSCDTQPRGYTGVSSAATPLDYATRPPTYFNDKSPPVQSQPWTVSPEQVDVFSYDDSPVASQFVSGFPVLQPGQPMTVQPSTRNEGMVYPDTSPRHKYVGQADVQDYSVANHVRNSYDAGHPQYEGPPRHVPGYRANSGVLSPGGDRARMMAQSRNLDMVQSHQRNQPPSKRGPFKSNVEREQTAETRKIGSCIRCRMQRIRCATNPDDKLGTCLTCSKVSNGKIWRLPCLRYKITDVKLFKPGQVKGHEWTRRWTEGIADDISQWASPLTKNVSVTEGWTQPVLLRVRQFIPQDGDSLERTWVYNGTRRSVTIPAYAIVNIEEAKTTYIQHINQGVKECLTKILQSKEKLIAWTYGLALKAVADETLEGKERDLIRKVLQLWVAIRMTTKSTVIVGDETLGMSRDIMDDTSPLKGEIPLPPVMGAQIELVLIHQIQAKLRREVLEHLQVMIQANNHATWLTTYLVIFILLHNVSLLCQHDAGYARKHGIKARFAREDMVREYQMGANIFLAYFHYVNKGIHPFSAECKEQDLKTLANLDQKKVQVVHTTRRVVQEQKKLWEKVRQSNAYENDFYFISQMYEENWLPQPLI